MTYATATSRLPTAKVGDVVCVHVPRIGVFRVDGIFRDPRGNYYYKLSRRTDGGTEFRTIATTPDVEILTPRPIDRPSANIGHPEGLTDRDARWAAINAGNENALKARLQRGA